MRLGPQIEVLVFEWTSGHGLEFWTMDRPLGPHIGLDSRFKVFDPRMEFGPGHEGLRQGCRYEPRVEVWALDEGMSL